MAIETQLASAGAQSLSLIDLSEVTILDFSCADEVVAKLLQRCLETDTHEAFFMFRGVRESHRDQIAADLDDLRLVAPTDGRVLDLLVPKPGTSVEEGEAVLVHGSGAVEAVFHVRALDFQSLRTVQGDRVVCRSPAYPARDIVGEVTHIGRVGARAVEPRVARAVPDGLVPVNSATGEVIDAYFEIHLRLPPEDAEFAGSLLKARFPAYPRTTAQMLERRVKRFLNRIRESNAQ